MRSRLRLGAAPAFLFLCLLLGSSIESAWTNLVLELLGLGIMAWAALAPVDWALDRAARQLLILAAAALILVAIQLVPLPPTIWPHLGGRQGLAAHYRMLGLPVPWQPLSLTPDRSLDALLKLAPPLAMICAIVRLRAYRSNWLVAALVSGTFAAILLGALKAPGSNHEISLGDLTLGPIFALTNTVLASANQTAILLVIALPFLATLFASRRRRGPKASVAIGATAAVTAFILLVAIALSGSVPAYCLSICVTVASGLLFLPHEKGGPASGLLVGILLLITSVTFVSAMTIGEANLGQSLPAAIQKRELTLTTTLSAVRDFLPFGSGLGSFDTVYRAYRHGYQAMDKPAIHAGDDYVELALELGIPGILLMLAFLGWWSKAAWRAWQFGGSYARAASIACAAVLIDSIIDSPLRTEGIGAAFAMCLALQIERRGADARSGSELWPTRHLVLT